MYKKTNKLYAIIIISVILTLIMFIIASHTENFNNKPIDREWTSDVLHYLKKENYEDQDTSKIIPLNPIDQRWTGWQNK